MTENKVTTHTKQITLIGLMTAVVCILGPLSIPLPISPVPISFTNLAIFLAVYLLDLKGGTVCLLVYLALGAAGLPIFSGFSGGLGKLAGPTGGYLYFPCADSRFPDESFPREKYCCHRWNVTWYGCMLLLRNCVARMADESFLYVRPFSRRSTLSAGRCRQDPCSGADGSKAKSSDKAGGSIDKNNSFT